MSGIVGIVNFDGKPVDPALLTRMAASLDFRGPDARQVWIEGHAGFGHTLLRTTFEAEHETQPLSFDGKTWIVADCRVDAREGLVAELQAKGREAALDRPDVELILHAWHVWSERCVEHLLGDFAFAIWDGAERKLFCARDHMGVKPFYYAHVGQTVVFSNALDCVRLHPDVSNRLNDLAVADFLLFGFNQEKDTTTFADIGRILPAHVQVWSASGQKKEQYWTLPVEEPVYMRRLDDYTDKFLALMRDAVGDRLRTDRVGILMSGGLDSSSLAAVARDLLGEHLPGKHELRAFTSVYDRLIPDNERYFAGRAAEHLGIPITFDVRDDEISISDLDRITISTPEPVANPAGVGASRAFYEMAGRSARVFFYGEGPDVALRYEWRPYLRYQLGRRAWGRLFMDAITHVALHGSLPLFPTLLRRLKGSGAKGPPQQPFPDWVNPDLVERLDLRARWEKSSAPSPHPVRPEGYSSLHKPVWQALFEEGAEDSAYGRVELRHPFVDVRVLQFLLSVPTVPWCRKKYLIRRATRDKLPRAVRKRPKTAQIGSPDFERVRIKGLPTRSPQAELAKYVDVVRVPVIPTDPKALRLLMRPNGLNYWLQNSINISSADRGSGL